MILAPDYVSRPVDEYSGRFLNENKGFQLHYVSRHLQVNLGQCVARAGILRSSLDPKSSA